jgi:hypothetical protein
MLKEMELISCGLFVYYRFVSAVKRVEFDSDTVSYIVMRGYWFNIILLNVHATRKDKSGNSKDSILEQEFSIISVVSHINSFRRL